MRNSQKQVVVIFDGPDRCGKTNISKAFAWRYGIPYFKNESERTYFDVPDTTYFTNATKYIDSYMASFLLKTGTSVILDRAWPSEFAYPRVFNRKQDMGILREIDRRWSWLDTRIVITHRSSYVGICDQVHDRITSDKLQLLDEVYHEFADWTMCKTLLLNVDDEDLTRELSLVENFVMS